MEAEETEKIYVGNGLQTQLLDSGRAILMPEKLNNTFPNNVFDFVQPQ